MNNLCSVPVLPDNVVSVLGIGTDICAIQRINDIYSRFTDKFLMRIFAADECMYFKTLSHHKKIPFLAKRFATKEAIAKALGTGIGAFVYFTEISCLSQKNMPPIVTLTGVTHNTALRLAALHGYDTYKIHISISDDTDYATAFTIITGGNLSHDTSNTPK